MRGKKKPTVTDRSKVVQRSRFPVVVLLRMFLLGSVAIVASVYAIWRYYSTPYQKMLVPKPAATEVEIEYAPDQPIPIGQPADSH